MDTTTAIPVAPQDFDQSEFEPPVFGSVEEERIYRKQRLAAAFRIFAKFGFEHGLAGHITVRDPEYVDCFWVNPVCVPFSRVKVSDLLLVNTEGEVLYGKRPVNTAAFAIHSQVHTARPDVVAAAHAHSPAGSAWSSLGRPLDPITQDHCAFYEDHAVFDDFTGIVIEIEEGERIAEALGPNKAVIMRNHGIMTVGHDVDSTVWWFVQLDRCCQVQLMAEAAGTPTLIPHDTAALTHGQIGTKFAGYISAKPLFDAILYEQPDLLG